MLDIKFVRENVDLVKESMKRRGMNDLSAVDKMLSLDSDWRKLKYETDTLKSQRNKVSQEINKAKKEGKDIKPLIKSTQDYAKKLEAQDEKRKKLEEKIHNLSLGIPNLLHEKVPDGKDDSENVEIKKWGKINKIKVENHVELLERQGLGDFEAGRINAGKGFNYLIGDMALLDLALQRYGVEFLVKKGFTLVGTPLMLNFETFLGAANGLEDFEDVIYKIEEEDLYMIGTAEHPLIALQKDKVLKKKDLPLKFCALTPAFRKEIGGHGVDMKGLFRMHQFYKVEQVVFCTPEKSQEMHDLMQSITEEFFQSLEIPHRVVEICTGDLGPKFFRQYDIEAWFPRQDSYREVTSAGNCTDFQSRALNIKMDDKEYPHILNNTMVATSRAMVAILENFQNKDGSVSIPKVLHPYMFGKTKIGGK